MAISAVLALIALRMNDGSFSDPTVMKIVSQKSLLLQSMQDIPGICNAFTWYHIVKHVLYRCSTTAKKHINVRLYIQSGCVQQMLAVPGLLTEQFTKTVTCDSLLRTYNCIFRESSS